MNNSMPKFSLLSDYISFIVIIHLINIYKFHCSYPQKAHSQVVQADVNKILQYSILNPKCIYEQNRQKFAQLLFRVWAWKGKTLNGRS